MGLGIAIVLPHVTSNHSQGDRAFLSYLKCLYVTPGSFHASSSCCQIPPALGPLLIKRKALQPSLILGLGPKYFPNDWMT